MSWGKDLWDQGENIALHTKKGIDFLERYANFLSERSKVENDYARQLKLLASKYQPKKQDEDSQFTHRQAFFGMSDELVVVANQHDRMAEQLREEIIVEIGNLLKRLRDQRKECLDEAVQLEHKLSSSIEAMRRTMKEYNRAYKESEAARLKYERVEPDMNLSRAEVLKAKTNSITKLQQAESAKNTYALQLQRTNEFQRDYYTKLLPNVFEKLREIDECRIREISKLLNKSVDIEKNSLPVIQQSLESILEHSLRINERADSSVVVQRYKSGNGVPQDFPFEDLSASGSSARMSFDTGDTSVYSASSEYGYGYGNNYQTPASPTLRGNKRLSRKPSAAGSIVSRVQSVKGGRLAGFFKSKSVDESIKDDYSDLPPQKQCQRLSQRVDTIKKEIDTKLNQMDGLKKMITVYRGNPHLGNAILVEAEYQECVKDLSHYQSELTRYQTYLKEACSRLNTPIIDMPDKPAYSRGSSECYAVSSVSSMSSSPPETPRPQPPVRPPPPAMTRLQEQREKDDMDDETLLRSESEYSFGKRQIGNGSHAKSRTPTPPVNTRTTEINDPNTAIYVKSMATLSASPESGFVSATGSSASGVALAVSEEYDEWSGSVEDVNKEIYENRGENITEKTAYILGTCIALYDFAGEGEGMVSMKGGEQMFLLERDAGDGWTKIRKANSPEDGFVPTSYLECEWYPEN